MGTPPPTRQLRTFPVHALEMSEAHLVVRGSAPARGGCALVSQVRANPRLDAIGTERVRRLAAVKKVSEGL